VRAAEKRMIRHEGGRWEMCWDGKRRVHLEELIVLVGGEVGDGVDVWVHPEDETERMIEGGDTPELHTG
jgi:hypothetical protein